MLACYQNPCRTSRDEGNASDGGGGEADSDDDADAVVDQNVPAEAAGRFPPPPVVRTDLDTLIPADLPNRLQPALNVDPSVNMNEITLHPITVTDNVLPTAGSSTQLTEAALSEHNTISTTRDTASEPAATRNLALDDSATTLIIPSDVRNLDDPEEYDWEGQSVDFGDEPVDESWDTWGCRHRFCPFDKSCCHDRFLVGVNANINIRVDVECMGCFKKTNVWDDTAEFTKFKEVYRGMTTADFNDETLKREWAASKTSHAKDDAANGEASKEAPKDKTRKGGETFVCRTCGVIFCKACRKSSRKRMNKERMAGQ
jgi:hypothetical protein